MEAYMTIQEVAKILKLSVQTIRRYVMKKEIPHHKIYRAVRFKPSEIRWWVEHKEACADMEQYENHEAINL